MSNLNLGALKRSSNKDMLTKLKQDVQAATSKNNYGDERFWEPTKDASGSGYAVIRFLPARAEGDLPFTKTYSHGFKSATGWFIDNCATTIGGQCPVCDANNVLWNSGIESNKTLASGRKRNLRYIANIYVVKDPAHPENNGKVMMFKFGQKIMDKIQTSLNGRVEIGVEPKNVFGFFDSVNFNLVMVKIGGFPNYDQSTFVDAADLYEGDETKLMDIMTKLYNLNEFTEAKQFKSYDDLKARFDKVTGATGGLVGKHNVEDDEQFEQAKPQASQHHAEAETTQSSTAPLDDDLAFFQSLAGK